MWCSKEESHWLMSWKQAETRRTSEGGIWRYYGMASCVWQREAGSAPDWLTEAMTAQTRETGSRL